ncbi:PREDICTED: pollen-specific leucine-rich repeat extensin-like protein 1 isoform X2 [Amphimedon queenslandica]|uniref:SRCR domain-containing protein n=1 Tax=Amphimedon queenslandica TaxID=400682 RepID=A0AAN0JGJ3_AMPQE|nr:PREDICTED: pollen-specific leucine-rich repeat extensin-like protein 1 isoform X1 [Amphimedon queenslandica]XP_019855764.1 PREDICTED: pollen-specific leucine-rich repeat extensin-like protein 1 isoform X2 [Amphimedon queenslandica]|eukprot:XP_019855763.1 PREDICTED: pollen-specific leucine-rich repeat extensin-like protein 1 isoform X1 [Amphimedon queenslandica]
MLMKMSLLSVLASFLTLVYVANAQGRGTVRLYSNNSTSSTLTAGIVQIYYGHSTGTNTWGNICEDDSFGHNEADVICNQLGYDGASTFGKAGSTTMYGTDSLHTIIDDVTCSDDDFLTLQQCSFDTTISSTCGDSNDAFVVCYTTRIWDAPYSGQIRLQNGTNSSYGRLEVYCNGQWGTVCDDSFGSTDARVACRQLGYSDSYTYTSTDDLGGSDTQAIWLSNIDCSTDSESCFAYCAHCPRAENQPSQCSHSQDISLGCQFNPDYPVPSNTLETCRYADDIASTINDLAAIIGGVVAVFIVCCILIITIPLCVCCCLGVGVGALIGGSTRRTGPQQTPAAIEAGAGLSNTRKSNPLSGTHPPPSGGQKERLPAQKKNPPTQKVTKQKPEDDITMQVCEPYALHKTSPGAFNDESPAPQEELPPPIEEVPPPISPPEEEITVAVKEEVPQEESPPPPPQEEEIQEISPPKEESPPPQDEDEVPPQEENELPPPEVPSQHEVSPPPSQDEVPPPEDNGVPPQDEAPSEDQVPPPPQDEASPQDDEVSPPQDKASPQDDEVSPPQDESSPQDNEVHVPPTQDDEVSPPQDDEVSPPQDVSPEGVSSPEVQEVPTAAAAPQEEIPQEEEPAQQENSTLQENEEEQPPTEI